MSAGRRALGSMVRSRALFEDWTRSELEPLGP